MGERCSDLNNEGWKQIVKDVSEQQSYSRRLIAFMNRVAKMVDEIRGMSNSASGISSIRPFSERGWKVLRSFVSQTDDTPSGVLTCLFLECMRYGMSINEVGKDADVESLEEYRWQIAHRCCNYENSRLSDVDDNTNSPTKMMLENHAAAASAAEYPVQYPMVPI